MKFLTRVYRISLPDLVSLLLLIMLGAAAAAALVILEAQK